MLNYLKIRQLCEFDRQTKVSIIEHLDITLAGYNKMMKQKTMKVETLEKIATYFNKPISYFFDEEIAAVTVAEPTGEYKTENWKEKYYNLLEKYNKCLEEKNTVIPNQSQLKQKQK